jgi:hypothetical protein
MHIGPGVSRRGSGVRSFLRSSLILILFLSSFVSITSQPGYAIPAFARKYGLPCSACHIGWPLLNNFGIAFKDNGYQLGNDKDSPIYQNPAYFPITFRVTPQWHLENTNKVAIDQPNDTQVEQGVTTHGFDLSGLDIWTAGTLSKNISFQVLPSMGEGDTFHFESAWIRFDNLLNSPWLNVKVGKFELDNLLSEKRFLTLSGVGGAWFNYHFLPPVPGGGNGFSNGFGGIGDNQLGLELSGHNRNSYSRYSIALLSSVDGNPGLTTTGQGNTARTYDAYVNVNQGFSVKGLGVQRVGAYAYVGMSPTYFLTSDGAPVQAKGNRSFSRIGAFGWWFIKDLDVETFYMHGQDNVFLGNGVAANTPDQLPAGAVGPTWNGGFVETHYTVNPQFILTGRYELVHMSRQANTALAATPNLGNVDSFTVGYRWYPIMLSRAGLAIHNEYSQAKLGNLAPLSGTDQIQRSVMIGFDFDY